MKRKTTNQLLKIKKYLEDKVALAKCWNKKTALRLACVSESLGDFKTATREYTKLIMESPQSHRYYCLRGNARLLQREYQRAIADYTDAIALSPNHLEYYIQRSMASLKAKLPYLSLSDLEFVTKVDDGTKKSEQAIAYYHLGCLYLYYFSDFKAARDNMERSMFINNKSETALYDLALVYYYLNDFNQASLLFDKCYASHLHARFPEFLFYYFFALMKTCGHQIATNMLQTQQIIKPNSFPNQLIVFFRNQTDLVTLWKSLSLNQFDPFELFITLFFLGEYYYITSRPGLAKALFARLSKMTSPDVERCFFYQTLTCLRLANIRASHANIEKW